jgi:hypothetical protein
VGTFVFAVNVAGATPSTEPSVARREAPPSAMADGGGAAGSASAATAPGPGRGPSIGWVVTTPSLATRSSAPATTSAPATMGVDTVDNGCRWCDDPHDGSDQDGDGTWWSDPTATPTPTPTATPQPSPSDDLSLPTSDG